MSIASEEFSPIYLYASEKGIFPLCATAVHTALKEEGIPESRIVRLPDKSYLSRTLANYERCPATLVTPGGDTIALASDLQYMATRISSAVSQGLNYLGICAGANYACKALIGKISKDQPINMTKIADVPFLRLIDCEAHIPVYDITKTGRAGADNGRMVPIITPPDGAFDCYWNEGSKLVFGSGAKEAENKTEAEAFYADLTDVPLAAASGTYGKGKVFITEVHPESDFGLTAKKEAEKKEAEIKRDKDSDKDTREPKKVPEEDFSTKHRKKFLRKMFKHVNIL